MASCRGIGAFALSVALSVSVPAFAGDEPPEHQVAAPTKELTIVSWGGAYTRSQMLAYVKPYRISSGEWVSMETYNGGLDEIREQVETENVTWDVVDFELSDLIRGCREGLLEEFDHGTLPPGDDGTSAADDFIPGAFTPCGVGQTVWSTVVGYDTEAVGESAPATLADFFDVDAFPGKRGLRRDPRVILEWALIADGAAPEEVYALLETEDGLDRAGRTEDIVAKLRARGFRGDAGRGAKPDIATVDLDTLHENPRTVASACASRPSTPSASPKSSTASTSRAATGASPAR